MKRWICLIGVLTLILAGESVFLWHRYKQQVAFTKQGSSSSVTMMARDTSLPVVTAPVATSTVLTQHNHQFTPEQIAFQKHLQEHRNKYWAHEPRDLCTKLVQQINAHQVKLDTSSQQAMTRSLLKALDVPVSSQLLVYSGTASQGIKVAPGNPRALYFNEEVYIGVVPGGFIEMVGIDPEYGAVLYSFEKALVTGDTTASRTSDCLGCHSTPRFNVGMVTRSVAPFTTGGWRDTFRRGVEGHQNPLSERYGGWHVTGQAPLPETQAEVYATGEFRNRSQSELKHLEPDHWKDQHQHLLQTSDILALMVHDHQMGFVNRVADLVSYARDGAVTSAEPSPPDPKIVDVIVNQLVHYVLYADEARLPTGGIVGDSDFEKDFARNRHASRSGASFKDFDLKTHLFKYRCSYMIYSRQWLEIPASLKSQIYAHLKAALTGDDPSFDYLSAEERSKIIEILRDTVSDFPPGWT